MSKRKAQQKPELKPPQNVNKDENKKIKKF